jgi:RNA recognition motif-containing protein
VENPGKFHRVLYLSVGNNVYVAGIPRRINEEDLRRVFGKYGHIVDIKVIKDPVTNNSTGFAYILFEKVEDATRSIECLDNQRVFNDWSLRVERAKRAVAYQVYTPQNLKVEISGRQQRRHEEESPPRKQRY